MEYLSLFGLFAFIYVFSIGSRVSKLERTLRENGLAADETPEQRMALPTTLREYIGQRVELHFYDQEGDPYLSNFTAASKGFVEIVDVDETWVLLHAENKKTKKDELVRISSIKGITVVK